MSVPSLKKTVSDKDTEQKLAAQMPDFAAMHALSKLSPIIVRKAHAIISHLLIKPGSNIAVIGQKNAPLAFALSVINPRMRYTAFDLDARHVKQGTEKYRRSNLRFEKSHIAKSGLSENSYDAVICVDFLHQIYSGATYNKQVVEDTIAEHMRALKEGGIYILYDIASPPEDEFVLLELKDDPNKNTQNSDQPEAMSDAERLIWFSANARPLHPQSARGFYMEELSPRFPGTRLFRLSSKWAYEFILRKDMKGTWSTHLNREYTFYTDIEYRRQLRRENARLLYRAPQWNSRRIKDCFEGRFKLYDENSHPMGFPPTGYICVSEKSNPRAAARIKERRQTGQSQNMMFINAVKDEDTESIHEIAVRQNRVAEILPYRISSNGRIHIFLHHGTVQPLTNTVKRSGRLLDDRTWSGHMSAALQTPLDPAHEAANQNHPRETIRFMKYYTGLKPCMNAKLVEGPKSFPAPDSLDDYIESYFVEVTRPEEMVTPEFFKDEKKAGHIGWYDAQDILRAIDIGLIPNVRLHNQIHALLEHIGGSMDGTIAGTISTELPEIPTIEATEEILYTEEDILAEKHKDVCSYRKTRGRNGMLRQVTSLFVNEALSDSPGSGGISAEAHDFVVRDHESVNRALIMPLARSVSGDVLAGFQMENLAVPGKYGKEGRQLTLPSLPLPQELKTIEEAKRYIADALDTSAKYVSQMGPSFFMHIDMTPTRVFPFAVGMAAGGKKLGKTRYAPVSKLWKINNLDNTDSILWNYGYISKLMGPDSDLYTCYMDMDNYSAERQLSGGQAATMSSHSNSSIEASQKGRSRDLG